MIWLWPCRTWKVFLHINIMQTVDVTNVIYSLYFFSFFNALTGVELEILDSQIRTIMRTVSH